MRIGKIYYTKQNDSHWKVWHEILNIDGDIVTVANYGKDTETQIVKMKKSELTYCLRKKILIPA